MKRRGVSGLRGSRATLQVLGDHVLVEVHLRHLVKRVHVALEELQLLLLNSRVVIN